MILLLALVSVALLPVIGSMTLSSEMFSLEVTADRDILSLFIEGPPDTPFSLTILDSSPEEVFERAASTDSSGSYSLFIPVFEDGSYAVILRSGSQTTVKDFILGKSTTTVTTTTSVTSTSYHMNATTSSTSTTLPAYPMDNETMQLEARINQPVKWVKRVKELALVNVPDEATKIKTEEILGGYEVEYETPPPVKIERRIDEYRKLITISSDTHYTDVQAYTSLLEVVPVGKEKFVKLYWVDNGRSLVTNINYLDENNNRFIDKIEWDVPHLSNQTYELEIKILDVHSYPTVGGNWDVRFETLGTADLEIKAVNGTTWTDYAEKVYDLKFLEVRCGNETVDYSWADDSVVISNYSCDQTGLEINKVLKRGEHTLEFRFGDQVAYAHNLAGLAVKGVQNGTVTMGTNPQIVTINAVNSTKSFVNCWFRTTSSNLNNFVTCNLTNSTTVTIQAGTASSSITVGWYVVEFESNVTVQRGESSWGTTTTSENIPINAVDASKTFVLIRSRGTSTAQNIDEQRTTRARLTNSTNLELSRSESGIAIDHVWQVIEIDDISVQNGTTTIGSGSTSTTETINEVNLSRSFVVLNVRANAATNGNENQYYVRGRFTNNTTVVFDRRDSTNTVDISWFVVSLSEGEVQNGTNTAASTETLFNNPINSVDLSRTSPFISTTVTGSGTADQDSGSWVPRLTNSNNLEIQRSSAQNRPSDIAWFVVEWPPDTAPPAYSSIQQNPSSPVYGQDVQCNTTWDDNANIDVVVFRSNYTGTWTNYTVADPICSQSGKEYYCTIPYSNLPAGTNVSWNYWANDTSDNWNTSMSVQEFTVLQATGDIRLWLNGNEGDNSINYPVQANATATLNVPGQTIYIYRNGTEVASGTSPQEYIESLSPSVYNFTAYFPGDVNSTGDSQTYFLTVGKGPTQINLLLNGTDGDENYEVGQIANITAVLNVSGVEIEIWANYTGVTENVSNSPGPTPLTNFTDTSSFSPGDVFNITGYFPGNENFTGSSESHLMSIATDATDPVISDVTPVDETGGFGRTVNITANVTDETELDTVLVNITLPDNSWKLYEMTNSTPDIYNYYYNPWQVGEYYYYIWANDTSGNNKTYHPYFYANGSAIMEVYTVNDTYGLGKDVNLTEGQYKISDDQEPGEIQKKALPEVLYEEFFDGFESGSIGSNWSTYSTTNGRIQVIDSSTDFGRAAPANVYAGTYAVWMDSATSGGDDQNELDTLYGFSGASNIILNFVAEESTDGDEADVCADSWTGHGTGDCAAFTCDGNTWYLIVDLSAVTTWTNYNVNISADPDFCSEINSSFAVRFQQDDNYPADPASYYDGIGFDDINVSYSNVTMGDPERNTSYTNYSDVLSGVMEKITMIKFTVNVSYYNDSGSSSKGNNDPDLQLEVYNGSGWIEISNFNVNQTGNFTLETKNSSVLSAWENASNRDLRIRGVYFDYYNSSITDEIRWTDIWVSVYNGSMILNTGEFNISGYLLMSVERNDTSWVHVETVVNDTNTSTLRNISSGTYLDLGGIWNADPWNTNSYPAGLYRVYSRLTDDEGNVLQSDDGSYINDSYSFTLVPFIISDVQDSPDPQGYGYDVRINATISEGDIHTALVEVTYPNNTGVNFTMTNVTPTVWEYNFSDTWLWGLHNYSIHANDTADNWVSSSGHSFNVSANANVFVETENETYGSNEDVNLSGEIISSWTDTFNDWSKVSEKNNITIKNSDAMLGYDRGDGSDGSLTVTAANTVINSYSYVTNDSITSGSVSFGVNDASAFGSGDEILVIQMQNSSTAGTYEFVDIQSINGNIITLTELLENSYTSNAFNQSDSTATQIVRVPQYTDVTVNSGASITAPIWDGYTGGIIVFRATGTVSVAGNINVTAKGFRAGPLDTDDTAQPSFQGESVRGNWSARSQTANDGAGGGGYNDGDNGAATRAGGGGGGGYGTDGENATNTFGATRDGEGGSVYGSADLTKIYLGSGGGSGGHDIDSADRSSGPGGAGGGIVFISADKIVVTGGITSDGGDGGPGEGERWIGGAGGSGGSILLKASNLTLGSNLVTAAGGINGSNDGTYMTEYSSGDGGVGRIRLDFRTLSGTASPSPFEENITYGNLTSVVIEPADSVGWDSFYANDDISGQGTNITYSIIDNSTGVRVCNITEAEAENGYSIASCAAGANVIKLYAEFNTTNASNTPVLHDWNVSWKSRSRVKGTGTRDMKGYLLMRVQRYSGGSWNNVGLPVVDDVATQTERDINSTLALRIDNLWNEDPWNTDLEPTGTYRAYVLLRNRYGGTLYNGSGLPIEGYYQFSIVGAELVLTDLEYENEYDYSIEEYETGDNIQWINVTVTSYNSTALNTNITLNVLDSLAERVNWGPNETQYCGDIPKDGTCEKRFDNTTQGYPIPLDATSGTYDFAWNVTMETETGPTQLNSSVTFQLHYMPDSFSSDLNPSRVYQNESTIYNFTLDNPWGGSLTGVNVSINCPTGVGVMCNCTLSGQEAQDYCYLGDIGGGSWENATFNVSTNETPAADYNINVTVNYTNPGNENHSWMEQENQVMKLRIPGQFVTIYEYPQNVTRGDITTIRGNVNNTLDSPMTDIWLNWTYPSEWVNETGKKNVFNATLAPGHLLWNNITQLNITSDSALGPQQLRLDSESQEGYNDWDFVYIDVYANTSLKNPGKNYSDPVRGEAIKVWGRLFYDNGSVVTNENVSFYDTTDSESMGWDLTNSTGWAEIIYVIPYGASVATHTVNVSYGGSTSKYTRASWNTTTFDVHDKPTIQNATAYPQTQGYGYNVTIKANVTDSDTVSTVRANVTYPNGTWIWMDMPYSGSGDEYLVNFTDTWQWGNYPYYIWSNDTAGKTNQSSVYYFYIKANATVNLKTVNDTYGPNEYVNLTPAQTWDSTDQESGEQSLDAVKIKTFFDGFESGSIGANWSTSSTANGRIQVIDSSTDFGRPAPGNVYSGTYAAWMDAFPTGTYSLNEMATSYDFTNASNIVLDFYATEAQDGDEADACPASWTGSNNCDGVAFTCDGNTWYLIVDLSAVTTWTNYNVNISADPDFCSEINNSFAVKFQQYDNYDATAATYYDGIGFDDINITYSGFEESDYNSSFVNYTGIGGSEIDKITNLTVKIEVSYYNASGSASGMEPDLEIGIYNGSSYVTGNYCNLHDHFGEGGSTPWNCTVSTTDSAVLEAWETPSNRRVQVRGVYLDWTDVANWTGVSAHMDYGSRIDDIGKSDISGYLLMQVQTNISGSWQVVSTRINDTNTSTLRNISSGTYLDLAEIWNADPWNTNKEPNGTYRIYAAFTNLQGEVLRNDDGSYINGTHLFALSPPNVILNVSDIKIYDVTGTGSGNHTDTSSLIGSGTNTTFDLYTGKLYRVEIAVENKEESSDVWNISPATTFHEELNSSWNVTVGSDIWYSNWTDTYYGGNWSNGNVTWNTSQGGMVQIGENVTFYYVVNISTDESEVRGVHFHVQDPNTFDNDYSTYNVILSEAEAPHIYLEDTDNYYNLNATRVNRNYALFFYARWDENIDNGFVEYNSTNSTLYNYTIETINQDWTNHTITPDSDWVLGNHSIKFYVNDSNDNWNGTLFYRTFEIWGWSEINESSLTPSPIEQGNTTVMACRVRDADNFTVLTGYTVSFYNSTHFLGTNVTGSDGWAYYNFTDNSLGSETITCNISDNATMLYNASANNQAQETLTTTEAEPPKFSNLGPPGSTVVHKDQSTTISSYWTDNCLLGYAVLSTNETGTWENKSAYGSPQALSEAADWSNFTWSNISMTPGIMGWKIHANDSFGNWNVTTERILEVWGWAEISDSSLDPNIIWEGESTVMSCRVTDSNSSDPIGGYIISFYNSTHLLGSNITNSSGWAKLNFTDTVTGTNKPITCNISDNATLYYNASENYEATRYLNVQEVGADVIPPHIYQEDLDNYYNLNETTFNKGDAILAYAKWNETISYGLIKYNSTNSTLYSYPADTPYTGNWTNYTIVTTADWVVGKHVVKFEVNDTYDNWNDTLPYRTFNLWGTSRIDWLGPTGNVYRGDVTFQCNVTDEDSGVPINGYTVYFYNSTDFLGSNDTDSSGLAVFTGDIQDYSVGAETFNCLIQNEPSLYYNKGDNDQDSETLYLYGVLNVSVTTPANETVVTVGDSVNLNSTTKDENDASVTPDAANWTNTTDYIGSGENTTWNIPVGHSLGPELITINVTGQYYDSDEDNVTIYVWGWSEINWTSPDDGEYSQGTLIDLECRVTNSNSSVFIQDYPVNFYVENSTDSFDLGASLTNSSGYATLSWDTTSYSQGIYYPRCNITDNSTLYYNASEIYEDNTTVNITTAAGKLIVELNEPPDNTIVPQYRNFTINATVTCRDANCGVVQGRARYNSSPGEPDTDIPGSGTPFYTFDSNPQSCGSLNQDENCTLIWIVNSTGSLDDYYNIDVLFSSPPNDTTNSLIRIGLVLVLNVSTDEIDWGDRDPDIQGIAAPGNPYQIGLDKNSNDAQGLYIKGTDMTGTSTPIEVSNISWCRACAGYGVSDRMNHTYEAIIEPADSGVTHSVYFWLDTPPVYTGSYAGTVTIMANNSW